MVEIDHQVCNWCGKKPRQPMYNLFCSKDCETDATLELLSHSP